MNTQTSLRTYEEIETTLLAISRELAHLGADYVCMLHCVQQHRPSFYRHLEDEFGFRVLLCKSDRGIRATITRATLGASAVIVVENYDLLKPLFLRISEQGVAKLYVIKKSGLVSLIDLAQRHASEITSAVQTDPSHLFYQVDEDSADGDGQMIEIISIGAECPRSLSDAVASRGSAVRL